MNHMDNIYWPVNILFDSETIQGSLNPFLSFNAW